VTRQSDNEDASSAMICAQSRVARRGVLDRGGDRDAWTMRASRTVRVERQSPRSAIPRGATGASFLFQEFDGHVRGSSRLEAHDVLRTG
jgi:hypothetical protein